jgi:hypothetical protein
MANEPQSYLDVQENRKAEAKERARIRAVGEAFGEAALGGRTLSEALRSPLAQTSTKERRRIKAAYRQAFASANLTGENDSFTAGGVDNTNTTGLESTTGGDGGVAGFEEEELTIVVNGAAETRIFLTQTT